MSVNNLIDDTQFVTLKFLIYSVLDSEDPKYQGDLYTYTDTVLCLGTLKSLSY